MTPVNAATRRAVAYIAGRLISGSNASSVYDYSTGRHTNFSGEVSRSRVSVFDYDRSASVSGSPPSLFDYGNGAHIRLTTQGTAFKGFDYGSGDHFSGRVNGRSVSLFDYGASAHYNYTV